MHFCILLSLLLSCTQYIDYSPEIVFLQSGLNKIPIFQELEPSSLLTFYHCLLNRISFPGIITFFKNETVEGKKSYFSKSTWVNFGNENIFLLWILVKRIFVDNHFSCQSYIYCLQLYFVSILRQFLCI